jgi:hypothetical protein
MKGLDLRKTAVLDPSKPAELKKAFDLIEEVKEYLSEELGVEEAEHPAFKPPALAELAEDADALTNSELANLHAQYIAYAGFFGNRLAWIKAAYKVAESNLSHIKADLETKLYAKGALPKAEVPAHVKQDGLYRDFEIEYLKLYMMRTILEAKYDDYRKQADAISRLITLRTEELQDARTNIQGRGKGKAPKRRGRFG